MEIVESFSPVSSISKKKSVNVSVVRLELLAGPSLQLDVLFLEE